MDALEAILTRRSIRRFQSKDVPDDLIRQLLEAAMAAPSAHNEQPWHFIVVRDRAILDEIPKVHPSGLVAQKRFFIAETIRLRSDSAGFHIAL